MHCFECVFISVCVHKRVCTNVCVLECVYMNVCIHKCAYTNVCVYKCVCMNVFVYSGECAHGGRKSTLGAVSQVPSTLFGSLGTGAS